MQELSNFWVKNTPGVDLFCLYDYAPLFIYLLSFIIPCLITSHINNSDKKKSEYRWQYLTSVLHVVAC
jgi:hypothetical protein